MNLQHLKVANDAVEGQFLASKIKVGNIDGKGNIRIDRYNTGGSGTAADRAFGNMDVVEGNNCTKDLGFATSTEYQFTVHSLFEIPGWEYVTQ